MDEHTTKMCNEAWGRPSFAKVLIEVNALGELKRELQVAIPNIFGGKEVIVPLTVEYIWEPSQCKHCMVFGHKTTSCPKDVTVTKKDKGKKVETTDNEGFTTVINRKRNAAKPAQQVWKPRDKRGVSIEEKGESSTLETSPKEAMPVLSKEIPPKENIPNEHSRSLSENANVKLVGANGDQGVKAPNIQIPLGVKLKSILKKGSSTTRLPVRQHSNQFGPLSQLEEDVCFSEEARVSLNESDKAEVSGEGDTPSINSQC